MNTYHSEYVNEFGDRWYLDIDQDQGVALLRGTDIDESARVPVIEHSAIDLVLSGDEQEWLREARQIGTKNAPAFAVYRGLDTRFVVGSRMCQFTNDYCPICLRIRREFDIHHCIWSTEGGTSDVFNLLRICKSCHALLTYGCAEDRNPRNSAAFNHQFMHFGMQFIPREAPTSGKHQDRRFLDLHPKMQRLVDLYAGASTAQKEDMDRTARYVARVHYQYYRDVARGFPAFVDHFRLPGRVARVSGIVVRDGTVTASHLLRGAVIGVFSVERLHRDEAVVLAVPAARAASSPSADVGSDAALRRIQLNTTPGPRPWIVNWMLARQNRCRRRAVFHRRR